MTCLSTKICDARLHYSGMTVDTNGIIYFSTQNGSINVYEVRQDNFNTEPHNLVTIETELSGIVWNGNNNTLYICDKGNDRIVSYSIDTGNLSTLVGGVYGLHDGNFKDARFSCPEGIAIDRNGDLYITQLHCIRKINMSLGTVTTIAGSNFWGHKDGEAKQAMFNTPHGIAVSDDGTIYAADSQGVDCLKQQIRQVKDGIVSTIACIDSTFPLAIQVDFDGNLLSSDNNGLRRVYLHHQRVSTLFKGEIRCFCKINAFEYFVATDHFILKIDNPWKWKRWIWIGHLKENPCDCLLAILPRDMIKEIIRIIDLELQPSSSSIPKSKCIDCTML